MNRKLTVATVLAVLAIAIAAAWLDASTLPTAQVQPSSIGYGAPAILKISVHLEEPNIIPNSVNVLRRGASVEVIGQLRDDGTAPDGSSGDKVYSGFITLNQQTAGSVPLQVSASVRGSIRRATSAIFYVPVVEPTLRITQTIGSGGGAVRADGAPLAFELEPGAVTGNIVFTVTSYSPNHVPGVVLADEPIVGAVNISPDPLLEDADPGPSDSYTASVTVPLTLRLPAAKQLHVFTADRISGSWRETGDIATVASDGLSATFQTRAIGLLVLME